MKKLFLALISPAKGHAKEQFVVSLVLERRLSECSPREIGSLVDAVIVNRFSPLQN
jgi:hypothetical protein